MKKTLVIGAALAGLLSGTAARASSKDSKTTPDAEKATAKSNEAKASDKDSGQTTMR